MTFSSKIHRVSIQTALALLLIFLSAGSPRSEDISFPVDMLNGEKIKGEGKLFFPGDAKDKTPLVILAHGTRGIDYREKNWSEFLLKKGYATFLLDYFSPRGVSGRGSNIPRPPEDVWGAIKVLAANPRIDTGRIAVMGFSNGGSVTRSSAELNPARDTNSILPKAFIMLYGGCHAPIAFYSDDYKPALLYIVGSKDTLVKASTCLERKADSRTPDTEVMVIEGAYHMFDSDASTVINHPKWGTIDVRADSDATDKARDRVVQLLERLFN